MKEQTSADSSVRTREPIAIVGIGCRFPGQVNHPDDFWELLTQGRNAITDVPPERWSLEKFYDPDARKAGKIKNCKGGFVDNVDHFDANFFSIFPAEAHRMDPQQRLLLEVTYQALENAGIPLEAISGSRTAVFTGVFMNDYWDIQTSSAQREAISPHVPMGSSLTSIANRLSYVYNLKGPSVTLDTACSSSLVGVHLACQSIWNGESTQAIAGGVNAILRPESSVMMSKGNFLSPDGYCKTFDSRANGYVRSEGCGVVILKPLAQAQADGDPIYATILGSAVNQDGYTEEGFTVPSLSSQVAMLRTAYQNAGVAPDRVAYVEAHGTGTPVGDPIETNAFGEVIGHGRSEDNKCWVGSVKTNIGHLESAAGVAGLIKLALVLKHGKIPQNLHFEIPNPKIPFDDYRLRVPTQLTDLPTDEHLAIGGVNSFGAGGTNAHLVLQAYQTEAASSRPEPVADQAVSLFTLSARSEEALRANAEQYVDFLSKTEASMADICRSMATRRSHLDRRLSIAARSKEELQLKLRAFLAEESRPGMHAARVKKGHVPKIGFIFSGQGPQWYAMGQQLIRTSAVFREVIERIDAQFQQVADWSLLEEMQCDEASSRVSETRIAQPAIMAIQIGLAELWKSWGVSPAGCVGHSIGEVAAAYTAGSLTLEQAVEVIYHRSRGQHQATDKGKMLAAALTVDEARQAIAGVEDVVSIAAINGPKMLTLSGDAAPLERIAQQLEGREVFTRFLQVNVPFHSHHMEPLKEELISSLAHLVPSAAELPLYSTVTGKQEDGYHLLSAYWYRNVREPVCFTDALSQMAEDGIDTFIEIAPHPVLTTGALALLKDRSVKNALIVPSLRRKEDEALTMMGSLGELYTHGYAVNWAQLMEPRNAWVELPTYVWQHERYWFETPESAQDRLKENPHPHLTRGASMAAHPEEFTWDLQLDPQVHPYLEDHKVEGTVIFPGTGHLEVARAAAQHSFGDSFGFLEDVHFESALFLPEEGKPMDIRLEVTSAEGSYRIYSRPTGKDEEAAWTMHSRGVINYLGDRFEQSPIKLDDVKARVTELLSVSDFYLELKQHGLQYGEAFRNIIRLWHQGDELLSELKLHKSQHHGLDRFGFHPALLDACLHTILYAGKWSNEEQKMGIYLPVAIERFKLYQQPGSHVWCHTKLLAVEPESMRGDYVIFNDRGEVVAEIQGLTCKYIAGSRGEAADETYQGSYQYAWEPAETADISQMTRVNGDATGGCVIFADQQGVSDSLLAKFRQDNLEPIVLEKADRFQACPNHHYRVNPNEQADIEQALAEITARGFRVQRILYLWGLDSIPDAAQSTETLDLQQRDLAQHTLNTLRAVVAHGSEPALYIASQGADSVHEGDPIYVNQAALYGMGRVMMNEFPFVRTCLIDLPVSLSATVLTALYERFTLVEQAHCPELALRDQGTYVRKLRAVTALSAAEEARQEQCACGTRYRASVQDYGTLDGIQFRQMPPAVLGEDEVEIEVRAAGLNFKDVMNVMGLLSDEAVAGGIAGKNLGLECAGVVSRMGDKVKDLRAGDEVMAWSANSYAGYTVTPASCVVRKPTHLSFEEAATATVVYLTAHYSLNYLARLSAEDTVLIHAASGGVGIAAIRMAQRAGATIIATAGNEEKRAFVRSLGVSHVFDSRSLAFADQVRAVTQGRGVDVVLNSLSGKGLTQSMKCLAPFGRFIEIGKADIYQDTKLALKRFGENLSFHAVDVDRLMRQRPFLGQRLYQQVADMFTDERLAVHPYRVYPVNQLPDALRVLSKGGHIGKLVVSMRPDDMVSVLPAQRLVLDAQSTYLITGGASGFGLMLAEWLVAQGARHLVLLSRSGHKHQADYQLVEQMEAQGVEVYSFKADITDAKAVQGVVNYISEHMPPLRGVIHSAAVLSDATLDNTDTDRYLRVFRPKALGAWNLHQATQAGSLDFFLMLSSISSLFGLPGQSNYSAANNFLDRLAQHRQSQGLAGSSVNLGVLGMYAGMSQEGGNVLRVLANQGWLPLSLKQVTSKIEAILLQQPAGRMVANLDWTRFRSFFSHLQHDLRFVHFLQDDAAASQRTGQSIADQLRSAPETEQVSTLEKLLSESIAKIVGSATDQIDTDVSITEMGLDSLMLNQLRNWIQQKLEINFPLMRIAKGPSVKELAAQLAAQLREEVPAAGDAAVETPSLLTRPAAVDNGTNAGARSDAAGSSQDTSGIADQADIEVLADKWLVRHRGNEEAVQQRVFCFHPVGAGASMFSHFLYNPPAETDVLAVQLPGRENRADEAPYQDMNQLVSDLAEVIRPWLDKPFYFMGHSFGGIVAFELIHYLKEHFGIEAEHLIITGTIAPQLTKVWRQRDSISRTAELSYSEEKLLSLLTYIDDVDFLKRILPVMRKDMPLIMSYHYRQRTSLAASVAAFAAEEDEVVLVEEVKAWQEQTDGTFTLEVVSGDHWFLSRNRERVAERLQAIVASTPVAQ